MATKADSRVTLHMAASLDGFVARKMAAWTGWRRPTKYAAGETMDTEFIETIGVAQCCCATKCHNRWKRPNQSGKRKLRK